MIETCSGCKFYVPQKSGPQGFCFFNPPTPCVVGMSEKGPSITSLSPPVAGNRMACGHFQKRFIIEMVDKLPPHPNGGN